MQNTQTRTPDSLLWQMQDAARMIGHIGTAEPPKYNEHTGGGAALYPWADLIARESRRWFDTIHAEHDRLDYSHDWENEVVDILVDLALLNVAGEALGNPAIADPAQSEVKEIQRWRIDGVIRSARRVAKFGSIYDDAFPGHEERDGVGSESGPGDTCPACGVVSTNGGDHA